MDRNLERQVDYAKDAIDTLVAEIESFESKIEELEKKFPQKH